MSTRSKILIRKMAIPKLALYSMAALRASLGNNEYTRLVANKKYYLFSKKIFT